MLQTLPQAGRANALADLAPRKGKKWVTPDEFNECMLALDALSGGKGDGKVPGHAGKVRENYFLQCRKKVRRTFCRTEKQITQLAVEYRTKSPCSVRRVLLSLLLPANREAVNAHNPLAS